MVRRSTMDWSTRRAWETIRHTRQKRCATDLSPHNLSQNGYGNNHDKTKWLRQLYIYIYIYIYMYIRIRAYPLASFVPLPSRLSGRAPWSTPSFASVLQRPRRLPGDALLSRLAPGRLLLALRCGRSGCSRWRIGNLGQSQAPHVLLTSVSLSFGALGLLGQRGLLARRVTRCSRLPMCLTLAVTISAYRCRSSGAFTCMLSLSGSWGGDLSESLLLGQLSARAACMSITETRACHTILTTGRCH